MIAVMRGRPPRHRGDQLAGTGGTPPRGLSNDHGTSDDKMTPVSSPVVSLKAQPLFAALDEAELTSLADRAHLDADAGEGGRFEQNQHVDRVAVEAEGVLEEAVVGRVREAGEEVAVKEDATGLVVDLVLVAAAGGNLDGGVVCAHGVAPEA